MRLLRLGGTAALPTYFEIAERARDGPARHHGRAPPAHVGAGGAARRGRLRAALLRLGSRAQTDGVAPLWWFTVGGAAQPGETLAQAAVRELAEETGLRVDPAAMVGPVWRRDAVIDFNGSVIRSEEMFFVHRTRRFEPSTGGHTALERRYIHGHRWCDAATIEALVARGQTVYPVQLAELLERGRDARRRRASRPRVELQYIR